MDDAPPPAAANDNRQEAGMNGELKPLQQRPQARAAERSHAGTTRPAGEAPDPADAGLGGIARRANAGPHAASLASLQAVAAQRRCADCDTVRRTIGGEAPAQRAAAGGLPDDLRAGLES